MAAANKCLTQSNKSGGGGRATKEPRVPSTSESLGRGPFHGPAILATVVFLFRFIAFYVLAGGGTK
jgi:hypothetical protein